MAIAAMEFPPRSKKFVSSVTVVRSTSSHTTRTRSRSTAASVMACALDRDHGQLGHPLGITRQGAPLKKLRNRNAHPEVLAQRRGQPHRQQGMPAGTEEVVVIAGLRDVQ